MISTPIRQGQEIFAQLPGDGNRRILHPATVLERTESGIVARFAQEDLTIQPGQGIIVYFEEKRVFMQQAATIDAVMGTDDEMHPGAFGFTPAGEPVSAESRECYRVSLVLSDFQADLGDQFVPIQRRLDRGDALNEWTTAIGSAEFAILPGFAEDGWLGDTLLT